MAILTITLIGDAFFGQNCYEANAFIMLDGEKEDVTVYWDLIDYDDSAEVPEDEMCDWSNPSGAKLSGGWIADKFEGVNKFAGYDVEYINSAGKKL